MSTTSPVERIQQRVQQKLNEEFIKHLVNVAIAYHTRKRSRPGCDCSYCDTKRWAAAYVGTTNMRSVGRFYYLLQDNGDTFIERTFWESLLTQEEDQIKDLIEQHREFKRKETRTKLLEEKERVL